MPERSTPTSGRPGDHGPGDHRGDRQGPGGDPGAFEIVREFGVEASPQQLWDALTTGTSGWLRPAEYEPREGGAAPGGGTVVTWEPPHRLAARYADRGAGERELHRVGHTVEPRDGGRRAWLRFVHSGSFPEADAGQVAARRERAARYDDFHLHTLREYLLHFPGRPAAYVALDGPTRAAAPDALVRAARALGLPADAVEGARVRVSGPDGRELDTVVDFRDGYFLGLRTEDALYRFLGRNRFGGRLSVAVHVFGGRSDPKAEEFAWRGWLTQVFG